MNQHATARTSAQAFAADGYGTRLAPDTLRFERLLPGPVERVWAYLTEPEKRRRWMADGPMELTPGGQVNLVFRNGELNGGQPTPERFAKYEGEHHNDGIVLACEPNRLLRFSWDGCSAGASEVTFELTPRGEKVLLTVTHQRLASRDAMLSVAGGWHSHLALLVEELEGHERPAIWSLMSRYVDEYDARLPK
ncbi:SRPBCC family protein [Ancylobacter oerskovii]|uniref:SRPBCC family protein n=1 Tax=Ancylobacter oerskovii TaxID=459519 RepID=A0ABW4YYH6_9HYPH|nr:SRPBCC family protein [Ancylobacter oerskovii]MBS7541750.1 SRPBCC family protein [Ancylobacter oerskovii]